jgi:hypothetical protein
MRGAAAVAQGTLQGKLQAREAAQQQRQQDQQQQLQLFAANHALEQEQLAREEAYDQGIANLLPQMTPDHRAHVQEQLAQRAAARAQRRFGAAPSGGAFGPHGQAPTVPPVNRTQPQTNIGPAGTPVQQGTRQVLPSFDSTVHLPTTPAAPPLGTQPPSISTSPAAPAPAASPSGPQPGEVAAEWNFLARDLPGAPTLSPAPIPQNSPAAGAPPPINPPTPPPSIPPDVTAAAPAASSPAGPPSSPPTGYPVELPGFGTVMFSHFSPDDVTTTRQEVDRRVQFLTQYRAPDAATQARLVGLMRSLPPAITTSDDVAAGLKFLQDTSEFLPGGAWSVQKVGEAQIRDAQRAIAQQVGTLARLPIETATSQLPALLDAEVRLNQQLPAGFGALTPLQTQAARIERVRALLSTGQPADEAEAQRIGAAVVRGLTTSLDDKGRERAERAVRDEVKLLPPDQANDPAVLNSIRQRHGLEPLAPGAAPQYGQPSATKELDSLVKQIPRFEKSSPAAKRAFVSRLARAAQAAGVEVPLPASWVTDVAPDPVTQAKLRAMGIRLQVAQIGLKKAQISLDAARTKAKQVKAALSGPNLKFVAADDRAPAAGGAADCRRAQADGDRR